MRYPDSSPGYKGYTASGLKVIKFERDYNPDFNPMTLEYNFVKSFPISITSMPVTYNGSDLLRCSVGMTYIRYTVDRITGAQGPAPERLVNVVPTTPVGQAEVEIFNSSGIVLEDQYNEDERRDMGLIP